MGSKWAALAGAWQLGEIGYDCVRRQWVLNQARAYADRVGKPLLNISCSHTAFGDTNADIIEQEVSGFVKYTPGEPLPFRDNQFGAVYSSHTLEHCVDPLFNLAEYRRVADRVFLVLPNATDARTWIPAHRWIPLDQSGERWMKNPLFSEGITEFIDNHNLYHGVPGLVDPRSLQI